MLADVAMQSLNRGGVLGAEEAGKGEEERGRGGLPGACEPAWDAGDVQNGKVAEVE